MKSPRISTRVHRHLSTQVFCLLGLLLPAYANAGDTADFRDTVKPFLQQHCTSCHGADDPEAGLSLHALEGSTGGKEIATWKKVARRLAIREMPPEGEPQPDALKSARIVNWIKQELTKAGEDVSEIGAELALPGYGNRVDHDALFSGRITAPVASPARIWRIRPQIYLSTVPRISKDARVGQPFSTSSAAGFKDYSALFVVDEPTINQLFRNASQLVSIQCGELRGRPVKEFAALLEVAGSPDKRTAAVAAAINRQFQMALLREPSAEELQKFTQLMERNIDDAGPRIGVKSTLATILMLPEAMYRFELARGDVDEHGRVMLAPREIAYAIAFALTDKAPDAELLKAAAADELSSTDEVRKQVERILNDPKADKPQIMRFFDEYFDYTVAEDVFKDLGRGQWRPEIVINDTRLLIQTILDEDRDVLKQLLTTSKSFVNARYDTKARKFVPVKAFKKKQPKKDKKTGKLIPVPPRDPLQKAAVHDWYGLPLDWEWNSKQPLDLPKSERAGVLTQPAWLAAFASNNENHPVQRGKWVRERLLGGVVPDLPISVDAKLPDAPHHTLRKRMDITTESYCWQCHKKMNPLGLMFENYNFLGDYRKAEPVLDLEATAKNVDKKGQPQGPVMRHVPVDATGKVTGSGDPEVDGDYKNAVELMHALADSPRVRQVFVRHAFRFWMGRNETLADAPVLLAADRAYVESGGSMKALITSLLTSDAFLYRRHRNAEATGQR